MFSVYLSANMIISEAVRDFIIRITSDGFAEFRIPKIYRDREAKILGQERLFEKMATAMFTTTCQMLEMED